MAWIVFWLAAAACALAATYANYVARRDVEVTIRFGIEKGVIADAAAIAQVRAERSVSWPLRLIVLGLLLVFASVGTGVFAGFLASFEPESRMPLLAIAAFTLCLAIGFLICGLWLRHALAKQD